jgi:hypothetical protein
MKRSSSIKLVLIGSGLVFLSACDQKPVESKTNEHAQAALNAHPSETFTSLEECEKTYGAGKCGTKPREGGGSLFMPMILGYTLGSMMNRPALVHKLMLHAVVDWVVKHLVMLVRVVNAKS